MADPPILALSSRAKEQDALLASWSGVGERIQRVVCRTSHAKFTSGSMGSVSFAPSGLGVSSLRGTHGLAPWAAFFRRFAAAVARNAPLGRGWTRHCERDL